MCGIEETGGIFRHRQNSSEPVVPGPVEKINHEKAAFMMQYVLDARRSGRSADSERGWAGQNAREDIVEAASDLYDKIQEICKVE